MVTNHTNNKYPYAYCKRISGRLHTCRLELVESLFWNLESYWVFQIIALDLQNVAHGFQQDIKSCRPPACAAECRRSFQQNGESRECETSGWCSARCQQRRYSWCFEQFCRWVPLFMWFCSIVQFSNMCTWICGCETPFFFSPVHFSFFLFFLIALLSDIPALVDWA